MYAIKWRYMPSIMDGGNAPPPGIYRLLKIIETSRRWYLINPRHENICIKGREKLTKMSRSNTQKRDLLLCRENGHPLKMRLVGTLSMVARTCETVG